MPSTPPSLTGLSPQTYANWLTQYFQESKKVCNVAKRITNVVGRVGKLFTVSMAIPYYSKTLGLTTETNGTDLVYFKALSDQQLEIVGKAIQIFSDGIAQTTNGLVSFISKPNLSQLETTIPISVNLLTYVPNQNFTFYQKTRYPAIILCRKSQSIGVIESNINLENFPNLIESFFHELTHLIQYNHPHEMPCYSSMPEKLKELWCFHKMVFSSLLYDSKCETLVFNPTIEFPDTTTAKQAMEKFVFGQPNNFTEGLVGIPIIDQHLFKYTLAKTENEKVEITKNLGDFLYKTQEKFGHLIETKNPNKNLKYTNLLSQETIRQTANSFAMAFSETLLKSFFENHAININTRHTLLNYIRPLILGSIEIAILSTTNGTSSKKLGTQIAIALGPRILETCSVQLLGRIAPACLPTLRKYHGYLGLSLIGYSMTHEWETGLCKLSLGFLAGHLGQLSAFGIIKMAQNRGWGLAHPYAEDDAPASPTQVSPELNAETPNNNLDPAGQLIQKLEAKATAIDKKIGQWVEKIWGLKAMYQRILPAPSAANTEILPQEARV